LIAASYYSQSVVHSKIGYPGVPEWVQSVRIAGIEPPTKQTEPDKDAPAESKVNP